MNLNVYLHVAQIEELPKEEVAEVTISEDAAGTFVTSTKADVRIGGDKAFYVPAKDYIEMPQVSAFESTSSYYATLFHALGHLTGHEKVPRPKSPHRFGTEAYPAESVLYTPTVV